MKKNKDKPEKIKKIRKDRVKLIKKPDLFLPPKDYLVYQKEKEEAKSFTKKVRKFFKPKEKSYYQEENDKKNKKKPLLEVMLYNPDLNSGLNKSEVVARKQASLSNYTPPKRSKSLVSIILSNFFSFFNIIMFVMVGFLAYAKATFTNYFFLFAVVLNFLIYVIQEIKAKKTIDRLSLKTKSNVPVIRDGKEEVINSEEIVINDIVILKPGSKIPCDLIVRSKDPIEVNESILTGEADSVIKKSGDIVYAGSYLVSGTALAQAIVVGKETYLERLSSAASKYKKPKSEIIGSINVLIRALGFVVIILGAILIWLSTRGKTPGTLPFNQGIISSVGALAGMIPAGLVIITSMALAVGVIRLSQSNTLVQELSCIEMLARVDTLCLDKTGTLTDGTMSVLEVSECGDMKKYLPIDKVMAAILKVLPPQNATDNALFERFGDNCELGYVEKLSFNSRRKFSAVEFRKEGTYILGAPEFVLGKKFRLVAEKTEKAYRQGLRVLVLAHSKGKIDRDKEEINGSIEPVALIILEDHIRSDALDTINYFRKAGVDVKVISGDNPGSVSRIAQKVGIKDAHKYIALTDMTQEEIEKIATEYVVFGRVTPDQKKWLIQALKKAGKTVAMTGDGVNDILALKEADTSIAMASGSEAARNISNLVLLDSRFSSMPKVVKEGRRVINNIKKVATIFITKNIFSTLLTLITIILQLVRGVGNYPINPSHLILIEWFIVGIPSFFLAMEYNDSRVEKSGFLKDIIKNSIPGAIAIILSVGIFYLIKTRFPITEGMQSSTIIVYAALSVFMYVLFQNCKPFNLMRIILVTLMYSLIILGILIIPSFFGLSPLFQIGFANTTPLNQMEKLVAAIMILIGYPIAYAVTNIGKWISSTIKKKPKKEEKKK